MISNNVIYHSQARPELWLASGVPCHPGPPGFRPVGCFAHVVPLDWLPATGFLRLWAQEIKIVILLPAGERGGEETGVECGPWPNFPGC